MSLEAPFWPRPNSFPVRSCVTYFDLAQTPSQRATSRSPFSSPCRGKTRSIASKFASNSSFAARRKQRSVGGNHFHLPFGRLPTSFARFNATPSKRKASRSSFSSWRRRIVSGTQGVATLHPGETSLETTTGTPLQSRSSSYDQHELLAVRIPHDKHDMEADPRS